MEAPSVLLALRTVLQAVQHAGDLLCTCAEAADALLEVEPIPFSMRSGASGSRPGKSPAVFVQTIDMRLQRRQAMKRCTQAGPVRVSERRTVWQRPVGIAHHPVDGSRMPGAARGVGQQLGHEVRLVENERGANVVGGASASGQHTTPRQCTSNVPPRARPLCPFFTDSGVGMGKSPS